MKLQDFWSHVDPASADMCWEWGRGVGNNGYGRCSIGSHQTYAHRVAYSLSYGPIEKGLFVRHLCHNRKCCNPAHLATGTHQDNMDDMRLAARSNWGEKSNFCKITESDVLKIKQMAQYRTQQATADHFGLNQSQVSRIVNGKRWAHL
jgi:hypothetical protein